MEKERAGTMTLLFLCRYGNLETLTYEITTNQRHKIIAMVSTDKITEIFCMADDFCKLYDRFIECAI